MEMSLVGVSCFDAPYYKSHNPALPPMDPTQLWEHFVHDGQFEARPFRFTCSSPPDGAIPWPWAHGRVQIELR